MDYQMDDTTRLAVISWLFSSFRRRQRLLGQGGSTLVITDHRSKNAARSVLKITVDFCKFNETIEPLGRCCAILFFNLIRTIAGNEGKQQGTTRKSAQTEPHSPTSPLNRAK
ncbi:MAG: hypothetical protein ACI9R3_001496 [Verrucomicrobiales bacterium]|jgi:hypothetical protein